MYPLWGKFSFLLITNILFYLYHRIDNWKREHILQFLQGKVKRASAIWMLVILCHCLNLYLNCHVFLKDLWYWTNESSSFFACCVCILESWYNKLDMTWLAYCFKGSGATLLKLNWNACKHSLNLCSNPFWREKIQTFENFNLVYLFQRWVLSYFANACI